MYKRIAAVLVAMVVGILGVTSQAHAATGTFTQGDYNSAVSSTISPIEDAVTGFLANGWLMLVSLIILVALVVLAWRLGWRAFRHLGRLGRA